jgi:hypothetical protein
VVASVDVVHGPGQFESNDTYELLHGIVQAEYIASTIALQMFVVSFRGGPLYYHVPEVDFRLQPIGTIPEAMPTVDYILYGQQEVFVFLNKVRFVGRVTEGGPNEAWSSRIPYMRMKTLVIWSSLESIPP